ncbi:hypothetical protein [Varibaculum vaginae]|uniref:hypothetical protein n=1 Tax=Varibaculum vaginae TaxID=2364797 RepID=UPI000F087C53|nr:hypothetical protein [Varibaculum vaginae]
MSEQPGYGARGAGEPQMNSPTSPAGQGRYFPPRNPNQRPRSASLPQSQGSGIPQVSNSPGVVPHNLGEQPLQHAAAPRPARPLRKNSGYSSETAQLAASYPQAHSDPLSAASRQRPSTASSQKATVESASTPPSAGGYDAPASVYGALPTSGVTPIRNFAASSAGAVTGQPSPLMPGVSSAEDQQVKSPRRSPLWLLYGLVVLLLIALVSWQIVRLSTGKVPSAIPLGVQPNATETVAAPEPKPIATAQSEQVKKVLAAQPVSPAQLGGDKKRVTFRSQSGIVVCTIAQKLEDGVPPLVPLAADASGVLASGSGVICATASNFDAAENVGKCNEGDLRLSVLGMWDASSGIGGCVNGTTPLYQDVVAGQTDNSGKRFDLQSLGPGQYTQLGKYACTFGGSDVTCLNVSTGKGFSFVDLGGYKFF